MMNEDSNIHD